MKTNALVSFLTLLLILSGCVVNVQDTVTGNGNVTRQKRDVAAFTGIQVGSGIDVILTQGVPQSVEVEADENLQEWINTEVTGGILHINTDKSIRFAKTKTVHITCQTLDKIGVSSAGDVTGTNLFKTGTLDIDMSSAGDLRLEVEADAISVTISSAGNVNLMGKTGSLKADLSSAGDLNAFDLEAKKGDVSVSSAGKARVYITEEASFHASSAGDIDYKGEPKVTDINTSSAGSVNKK
jgi:hypothetical protein